MAGFISKFWGFGVGRKVQSETPISSSNGETVSEGSAGGEIAGGEIAGGGSDDGPSTVVHPWIPDNLLTT